VIEQVDVQSEKRFNKIYALLKEKKSSNVNESSNEQLSLCDNYSEAYLLYCDFFKIDTHKDACVYKQASNYVNVVYGKNSLKEFSLNDFHFTKFVIDN
jgi:hypothetical protein